jgi:hypothetical protein
MLDGGQVLLEDTHGLIQRVVILLGVVDDLEERFDDPRDLVELLLGQFALLVKVLDGLGAVLHVHGDQVLLV